MNEEQKRREMQIEEMAQIICGRSKDDICLIDKTSCDSSCRWARNAEAIYNAGYRKLPEDSIVLSREESQALKKQIEYWEIETKVARKYIDEVRKETAKEICDWLEYRFKLYDYIIEKPVKDSIKVICKKYGVR